MVTAVMTCQMCHTEGRKYEAAYEWKMMGEGTYYIYRYSERVR